MHCSVLGTWVWKDQFFLSTIASLLYLSILSLYLPVLQIRWWFMRGTHQNVWRVVELDQALFLLWVVQIMLSRVLRWEGCRGREHLWGIPGTWQSALGRVSAALSRMGFQWMQVSNWCESQCFLAPLPFFPSEILELSLGYSFSYSLSVSLFLSSLTPHCFNNC